MTGMLLSLAALSFNRLTKRYEAPPLRRVLWSECLDVLREIWPDCGTLALLYCVSVMCFPGFFLQIKWWAWQEPWRSVGIVGIYNTADTIGRAITNLVAAPKKETLRIFAALRIFLIPMVICALPTSGVDSLQDNSAYGMFLMVTEGLS
jgi:hypothetical protein